MSSNEQRASVLGRALRAGLEGDVTTIESLCTPDVRTWSPTLSTTSLEALVDELRERDEPFSDFELDLAPLDVAGDFACTEWTVAMTHTGPVVLEDGHSLEATQARVTIHGVTVAEFDGDRICSVRQYWDPLSLVAQLDVST